MHFSGRTALVVLTVSIGVALVGCSAPAEPVDKAQAEATAQTIAQQQPATADAADGDDPCAETPENRIVFPHRAEGAVFAELKHELIDLGARDLAAGEAELDAQGRPVAYTVASGDSPIAIGDRFCVDYITVLQYNRTWPQIDPGEVLVLSPDPTVQWGDSTQPDEDAS